MKSIRNKFFLQVSSVVVIIILLLLIANNVFLEQYYLNKKETAFETFYTQINDLDESEYATSLELFKEIELTTNSDILITDTDGTIIYFSRPQNGGQVRPLPEFEIDSDYVFRIVNLQEVPGESLILLGELDNGYNLELRSPISAIQENISIVNEFILYSALVGVLISLITSYFLANHFAKPIKEINSVAKKIKQLDFSSLATVKTKDEIGELSESINQMADTISKTFDNLKEEVEQNKQLSKKSRDLVNNVSHELKTPLSLIQGYSEGLLLDIHEEKEKREYYSNVIIDEAKNMNKIIESLLSIADSDSTISKEIAKNVVLKEYLKQRINKHKMVIKSQNLHLETDIEENVVVDIDKHLIDRVLTNFITNAINYCEPDGLIQVETITTEDIVRIGISNTHNGLTEEELLNVWDSFYKTDKARTREKGGHGLGLSIVRSILTELNLQHGVLNKENMVEFWFELPISK